MEDVVKAVSYFYYYQVEPLLPGPVISIVSSYYHTFMYLAFSLHRGDLTLPMFLYIIFPKLLALLAVYWTALSLWRTARWAASTAYFIAKWSLIIALLAGSVGWILGGPEARTSFKKWSDEVDKVANKAGASGAKRPWDKFGGDAKYASYETEQKEWWQKQQRAFEEQGSMAKKIYEYAFNYVWDSAERAQKDGARAYGAEEKKPSRKEGKAKNKSKGTR